MSLERQKDTLRRRASATFHSVKPDASSQDGALPADGGSSLPPKDTRWFTWNVTSADWDIFIVSTVIKLLLYPS